MLWNYVYMCTFPDAQKYEQTENIFLIVKQMYENIKIINTNRHEEKKSVEYWNNEVLWKSI